MTAPTTSPIAVTARVALMIAAMAIVIGSYAPWLHDASGIGMFAFHGVDGHGIFTALCGVVIAVAGLIRGYLGSVVTGLLVSAVALVTYRLALDHLESSDSGYFGGSIGWGLYAVIGGGVAATAAGAICRHHHRTTNRASSPIQDSAG